MSEVDDAGTKGNYLKQEGEQKTHMDCHHCHKSFLALIDYSINGNHVIECAHCGHEHLRKIENGVVTAERWGSREQRKDDVVRCRRVWKSDAIQAQSTSVSEFIRNRWLSNYARGR